LSLKLLNFVILTTSFWPNFGEADNYSRNSLNYEYW